MYAVVTRNCVYPERFKLPAGAKPNKNWAEHCASQYTRSDYEAKEVEFFSGRGKLIASFIRDPDTGYFVPHH